MKTARRISCILLLGLFMTVFSTPIKGTDYVGRVLPDVVVTCSSGNYGWCFDEYCDWTEYDSIFTYKCKWTGSPKTYCRIVLVKMANTLYDYIV